MTTTTDIKMILTEEEDGFETTTVMDVPEDFTTENHIHLNEIVTESGMPTFIGYGIMIGLVMALASFGVYKGCKKLRRNLEYNRLQ